MVIVLCFLAVDLTAEPDSVNIKTVKGRKVHEKFPFGMVNSDGDSAYCVLESSEVDSNKRANQFYEGKKKRKEFFNENNFKKIIDSTNVGDNFKSLSSRYENMKYCKLCRKGKTTSGQAESDGDGGVSTSVYPSRNKNASSKLVAEENIETSDSDTELSNDMNRNSRFNTSILDGHRRWIVFGGVILLITIIVIVVRRARPNEQQTTVVLPDSSKFDFEEVSRLRNENQLLKDENQKLKKMTQEPITEIESFEKKSVSDVIDEDNVKRLEIEPIETQTVVQEKPREVFYFPTPIGNTFNMEWRTTKFIEDETLYRFERNCGEYSADVYVEIDEPSVVQRFIYSPESQFGVCETIGLYNKNAKAIKMIEPGEATLGGDNWIVRKKVKIQYC